MLKKHFNLNLDGKRDVRFETGHGPTCHCCDICSRKCQRGNCLIPLWKVPATNVEMQMDIDFNPEFTKEELHFLKCNLEEYFEVESAANNSNTMTPNAWKDLVDQIMLSPSDIFEMDNFLTEIGSDDISLAHDIVTIINDIRSCIVQRLFYHFCHCFYRELCPPGDCYCV